MLLLYLQLCYVWRLHGAVILYLDSMNMFSVSEVCSVIIKSTTVHAKKVASYIKQKLFAGAGHLKSWIFCSGLQTDQLSIKQFIYNI